MRAACLLLLLCLAGCSPQEAVPASLEALAETPARFEGRRVRVSGVLRSHAQPRHYWIEDDALHRVGLTGAADLQGWVGRSVEVTGRFRHSERRGRRIRVERLATLR